MLTEQGITVDLNRFYADLDSGQYAAAKDCYNLRLHMVERLPAIELSKLLQATVAIAKYVVKKETPEVALLILTQYLEDAVLHLLPRVATSDSIRFYYEIADLFFPSAADIAIYCYASALNYIETMQIDLELKPKVINALQKIEVNLLYQQYKPSLLNLLESAKNKNDNEFVYGLWQQIKPLRFALRTFLPDKYQKLFKKFKTNLKNYAQDFLLTEQNDTDKRVTKLQEQLTYLIAEQNSDYDEVIRAWALKVIELNLTGICEKLWLEYADFRSSYITSANLNPTTISVQYRSKLKDLRNKFNTGLKLNLPILELQEEYSTEIIKLLHDIAKTITSWLGTAPCAYALVGIGSVSRKSLSPYSDLDCAILIDDEQYKSHPYFASFILSIDAVLKCLAEPWVYHNKVASCNGLHIDTGDLRLILSTQSEKQVLLNTPDKLKEFVVQSAVQTQQQVEQTIAFSLLTPCLLYSPNPSDKLLSSYKSTITAIIQNSNFAIGFWQGIIQDNLSLKSRIDNSQSIDIKTQFINPLVHLCSMAAVYYQIIDSQGQLTTSLSTVLRALAKHWHPDYIKQLKNSLEFLYKLRAEQHCIHKEQHNYVARMLWPWQALELRSLTPWQGLVDLNYMFKPEANFHPVVAYAILFEELLNSGVINTAISSPKACKLLAQLSHQELYRIYLKLPNNYRVLIVEALQEQGADPYLVHLYACLPNAVGVSVNKEKELRDWQNILFNFTKEYQPSQEDLYAQVERVKIDFLILKGGNLEKETRIFPQNYSNIDGNRYDYFNKNGEFNIAQLKEHGLCIHSGRSSVLKLMKKNKLVAYAKIYPESPGVQLQADTLSQRLSGTNFHSTLAKVTPLSNKQAAFPLLFSQVVPETLQEHLNQGKDLREVEQQLDPFYFSLKLLEILVISPEDDKPDNVGLCRLANNQYRLISFDSDHAFYPAMVERNGITGIERKVQLKSILLCFLQMQHQIHTDAKALFLSFSPYTLLQDFLLELDVDYRLELFTQLEIQKFLDIRKCWLANAFEIGVVAKLYERINRIQAALQDEQIISHLDLLARIEPLASDYYLKLYQKQYTSPKARWEALQPDTEYRPVVNEMGQITCQSMTAVTTRAKRSLTVVDEQALQQRKNRLRESQIYNPWLALNQELQGIYNQHQQIGQLIVELNQANTTNFITAHPFIQEQVLKRLDFSQIDYGEESPTFKQSALKNVIKNLHNLCELHLQNYSLLNYGNLIDILSNNPELRVLNLSGCQNLSDDWRGMGWALKLVPQIEHLNLSGTSVNILAKYVPFFDFTLLKLKRIILRNCPLLTDLLITSPNLEYLQIDHCNALVTRPITAISQAYPKLKVLELINNLSFDLRDIAKVVFPQLEHLSLTISQNDLQKITNYLPTVKQTLPKVSHIMLQKYGILIKNLQAHKKMIYSFVVLANGNLVSGSSDNTIKIWDTTNYTCTATLTGHQDSVYCLAELKSGNLASGSGDNTIRIWNTASCSCIITLKGHQNRVSCLAELESGNLASGSYDHTIRIWDTRSYTCTAILTKHHFGVCCLAKLTSGSIASSSGDGTIRIWDTASYTCTTIFPEQPRPVSCLIVLTNGRLASGSYDGTIKIWDITNYICIATLTGYHSKILYLAELGNGNLVSSSLDGSIKIWDTTNYICITTLEEHQGNSICLAALANSNLASGSSNGSIKIWDFSSISLELWLWQSLDLIEIDNLKVGWHTPIATANNSLKNYIQFLGGVNLIDKMKAVFTNEERLKNFLCAALGWELASTSRLKLNLDLPNLRNLAIKNSNLTQELTGYFTGTSLTLQNCPYLSSVAITSHNLEYLKIGNCNSLKWKLIIKLLQSSHRLISLDLIDNLSFNLKDITHTNCPKLRQLSLTVSQDNLQEVIDYIQQVRQCLPRVNQLILQKFGLVGVLLGYHSPVPCLAQLSNGNFASGSFDGAIKIWDTESYTCIATLQEHQNWVRCLVELANGNLASGSDDGTIKIWDKESYTCITTLQGHQGQIRCLVELANGDLASGFDDGTIKIWDIAIHACITTIKEHQDLILCLEILANGNLVSSSLDKTIKIWDATYSCVATLNEHQGPIYGLVRLANGKLASGSGDNSIKIWDTASCTCIATLHGHHSSVSYLIELSNGNLASSSRDKTIKIWDTVSYTCIATLAGHHGLVLCLAKLANGNLASGSDDKTIKIWDFNSLRLEFELWQSLDLIAIDSLSVSWNTPNITANKSLIELALFLGGIKVIAEQQIECETMSSLQAFLLTVFGGEVNASGLIELTLKFPYLRSLRIKRNIAIESVTGDFTALEHLEISEGNNISDICIFNILRSTPKIQQINISYNPIFRFFSLVPAELKMQILHLLDSNDLKSFSCVSKIFYLLKQELESLASIYGDNTAENLVNASTVAISTPNLLYSSQTSRKEQGSLQSLSNIQIDTESSLLHEESEDMRRRASKKEVKYKQ